MKKQYLYVFFYLLAIVLANLAIGYFGIKAVYFNAFLFIGLDLTTRDTLHSLWNGEKLYLKMATLIFSGSVLSYILNTEVLEVAIASFVAFAVAAIIDSVVYHRLLQYSYKVRVNTSNVFSSFADSIIFPTIAFGGLSWSVTLGQFLAKFIGGFFWSLVLSHIEENNQH